MHELLLFLLIRAYFESPIQDLELRNYLYPLFTRYTGKDATYLEMACFCHEIHLTHKYSEVDKIMEITREPADIVIHNFKTSSD